MVKIRLFPCDMSDPPLSSSREEEEEGGQHKDGESVCHKRRRTCFRALCCTRNQRGWSTNYLSPLTQKLCSGVPRTCGLMTSGTDNFPSQSNWANFKAGKSEAPLWYVLLLGFAYGVGGKSTSFFFRHGSIITTPSGSQVKSSSLFLYYPSHSSVVIQGTNSQAMNLLHKLCGVCLAIG